MALTVWRQDGDHLHLTIEQGKTFDEVLTIENAWNVTAASLVVRATPDAASTLVSWTSASEITITNNASSVLLTFAVTGATTAALDFGETNPAYYEVEVTLNTGEIESVARGRCELVLEVVQ